MEKGFLGLGLAGELGWYDIQATWPALRAWLDWPCVNPSLASNPPKRHQYKRRRASLFIFFGGVSLNQPTKHGCPRWASERELPGAIHYCGQPELHRLGVRPQPGQDVAWTPLPSCPVAQLPSCPVAQLPSCPVAQLPSCPSVSLSDQPPKERAPGVFLTRPAQGGRSAKHGRLPCSSLKNMSKGNFGVLEWGLFSCGWHG